MLKHWLHSFVLVVTVSAGFAQIEEIPPHDPRPAPGKRIGTERWFVQFKNRSFDLSKFRAAVHARRPYQEVNAIVADIERKMESDQAGFVKQVEADFSAIVTEQYWLVNALVLEVDPKHLPALRKMPRVLRIHPDRKAYALIKVATNIKNHNADFVQKVLKIDGSGVTTAIMDTGLDENMGNKTGGRPHRTFYKLGNPSDTTGTGIKGSRLILNRRIGKLGPDDVHNHGTGVAGIAAGGIWGHSSADHGHAVGANVAGYAIANSVSGGGTTLAVIASAWQQMAKDRVQYNIVSANNSYTGTPNPTDTSQQALDAAAYNADIMVCVAAGNFAANTTRSQSCANGLAAAAIIANSHKMASFSSYGPLSGSNGRFYPDISGCGVSTIMPKRDNEATNYVASGTSMASPQICGIATLVRATNKKLTALETKSILLATTQSIATDNPGKSRNNYGMGMGRADLAVTFTKAGKNYGSSSLTTSTSKRLIPLSVAKGTQYAVCISWYRSKLTSKSWSDLNLRVLDGTAVVAESKTTQNLYEMTRFLAGKTGTYLLEVTYKTIDTSSVAFSWAFSETPPEPIAGKVSTFGAGCKGLGFPPGNVCQSANRSSTGLVNSVASDAGGDYLMEVTAAKDLLVEGFEIYSKATGANSSSVSPQTIITHLYDANTNGEPNKKLASSSMRLDIKAGFYRTTFGQNFTMKKGTRFFLSVEVPKTGSKRLLLPIVSSGTTTPWWVKTIQGQWRRIDQTSWNFAVVCKITTAGAVPVLSARNAPALGKSVTVDLRHGLPNSKAWVLTGFSNTSWAGVSLPQEMTKFGAPGCNWLVARDFLTIHSLSNAGGFSVTYTVPNIKAALGESYYHQALVVDPGANAFGASFTNGLRLQIGDF